VCEDKDPNSKLLYVFLYKHTMWTRNIIRLVPLIRGVPIVLLGQAQRGWPPWWHWCHPCTISFKGRIIYADYITLKDPPFSIHLLLWFDNGYKLKCPWCCCHCSHYIIDRHMVRILLMFLDIDNVFSNKI